ncbi:MAG: response regulator [Methylococcales bacterium]|jgi:CheY-like chemotaxis protein/Flp pilus assembly protein TadD|nr:response regulator [Methylococcales bacterium]MBT7408618.1 response regulator [Methylococcales bacterium]
MLVRTGVANLSNLSFLVIDDFANYRSMLKGLLRDAMASSIDEASDGVSAVNKIEKNQYDIILCDYDLGQGKNGQQILEEVKSRNLIKYSTIYIMVTAENTMDMVLGAVEYRPDDYLTKPFTKELLYRRLKVILSKKKILKSIYSQADKNNYEEAIKLCDKQILAFPKVAVEIARIKAEFCIKSGKNDLAESIYRKVLDIREFSWAKIGLGKIEMKKGNNFQAQEIFEEVVDENKTCIEAYDLLAEAFEKEDDFDNSQEILMKATKLSPNGLTRNRALTNAALKNDDLIIAEKACKAVIKNAKHSHLKSSSDHVLLAKIHVEKDQHQQALNVLNESKKEYKNDKAALVHPQIIEGIVYKKKGDEETAEKIFEETVKNFSAQSSLLPKNVSQDMLDACEAFGDEEMASMISETILQEDSDGRNSREVAKKFKLIQTNRDGMKHFENGEIDKALPMFEKAAHGLPSNISVHMNAAQALISIMQIAGAKEDKKIDKARKHLDIAKSIDASNEKYLKLENLLNELK